MPRTVKKLIASAARRTRNNRMNPGRAPSGNEMAQPQVRSRCQASAGSRMTGSASPRRAALWMVSSMSMKKRVTTNRRMPTQIAANDTSCGTDRLTKETPEY
jgi:hypothetical protein